MVSAAVVCSCQAPPAVTFLQDRHFQIPTAVRLVASWGKEREGGNRGELDRLSRGVTSPCPVPSFTFTRPLDRLVHPTSFPRRSSKSRWW